MFVAFLFFLTAVGYVDAQTQSQTFTSTGTFTVPAGVTTVTVQCWGGGGAGGGTSSNTRYGGGGGAGGSYASKVVTVVSGNSYTVTVATTRPGTTAAGSKGYPSWFGSTTTVYAEGGNGGAAPNATTVAGGTGSTSACIGDIVRAGGNGANGTTSLAGAGGGGAGSTGVGGNASGTTAGTGTTLNGGNGGAGLTSENDGNAGLNYGGGGSGAYVPDRTNHNGGTGAAGLVIVSWTVPTINVNTTSLSGFTYIQGYGPSSEQTFTVGGTALTNNITITPPINYQISTSSGSGFQSTPITLTQSGGVVSTTTIYVRLKAGLTEGTYNSENVVCSSTGATSKNVTCSGTVTIPTITTSTTAITTFSYPVGYGPSAERSFTVSGSNLTSNITLTPSANFEISRGTGAAFVASSLITLTVSGGSVATTTIYVRMKAGIAQGTVAAENIVIASTGATTKNVACSGTVTVAPSLTTTAVTGSFSYVFTNGPSAQQSFTVSGSNLQSNVTVTPPADYEISTTSGSGFQSTAITLTQTGGSLSTTTIYIRMKIGLGVGNYSENAVVSATYATSKQVSLSGTVTASSTIIATTSALSTFIYTLNAGPSGSQSFGLIGTNLGTNNITVTAPANFEIATTSGGTYSSSLSFTPTSGSVNTTVYARMKSGLAVGSYGPSNVTLTSTGAVVKSVGLSGSVVNTATVLISKSTLTGFGYMENTGPSAEQEVVVSGSSLTANITVTPPVNYEISTTSGSGFQSTAISLTRTSGRVNPTKIYVRLKSGLVSGNYNGINISVASTGATTKNVALVGIVFVNPLITAGGGGEYCAGSTINLTSSTGNNIENRYWQGPNSFYSTDQNPSITSATTAMSGTYKVTGNLYVGGNLITNGDFESGNTSFGSSYGYVAPTTNALWPEALYTVVASPRTVHDNFSACVDHTIGGATPTGMQMVINGAPTAGVVIWTQSVPVVPGASYEFSYWVQTVVATSPSQLQLYVNGVAAGPTYTADLATCSWKQFVYNTVAGSTTTALNLELINQNTVANGNDFALDDIVFKQILPAVDSVQVTVNPILPVSVSVVASENPVYQNTPVTYTATPTNGGTTPAYAWTVNGNPVGTNSPELVYTPSDGDVVACQLTSSLTCVTNNPASSQVVMTVNFRANYWMGYIDTDWGKAANWTANYIPLTGDDVEYATVANFGTSAMRDLQLDVDRTIGSLINATTKRLIIPAAKGLVVNNTITTDGSSDRIYIYSSSTVANGSLTFHNSYDYPVAATVEMYSKASWDLTAAVNNKFKWQYFGIPLRSVKAEPTFNGSYVRSWDETGTTISNHWVQLNNNSILNPFYGYELCSESPKTYYFKGLLVNSNFNSGSLPITATALYPGQHIFANPYTTAIDIKQITFGENIEASVYLYNTGTFTQWTSGGATVPGENPGQYTVSTKAHAGDLGVPRQVPSMQALLVKTMTTGAESYIAINYNSVGMNNSEMQRVAASDEISDNICTVIDINGQKYSDKLWLFTDKNSTKLFDNGYDGVKLEGSAFCPQIYSVEPDGKYQINSVSDINNTIIGFRTGEDYQYTMTFTHTNASRLYKGIYLQDILENKTIDVTLSGTQYEFVATPSPNAENRFKIITQPYIKDDSDLNALINVFNSEQTLFVQNLSNENGELRLYDISGSLIMKTNFDANDITSINLSVIPGAYVVYAKNSTEEVSKRLILK